VAKTGFLEFGHVTVDTLNVWIFRNFCTTWGIARAFQQEKSLRKQMFQSRDMRFFKKSGRTRTARASYSTTELCLLKQPESQMDNWMGQMVLEWVGE
jgi:hypothetical protein